MSMKKLFYSGAIGLILFEIMNVYFIMPMPGSQELDSIHLAYFLYTWRWVIRMVLIAMVIVGITAAFRGRSKWMAGILLLLAAGIAYLFNFRMTADKMFLEPENVVMASKSQNKLPGDRLVIGVEKNDEAKAYPVEFLAYHHQVRDSLGGKPIIVTYCSVCRTGRVFEPVVNGLPEQFRLVGMNHFNAMFEDATTKSWWRQVNGEAIAGSLKGAQLPEVVSRQMTVEKWFELYPEGLVMQPDEAFIHTYDPHGNFEKGKSKGSLTRTDSGSWKAKSWVIGIETDQSSKAYDWNELLAKRVINDTIGEKFIVLALASDGSSFAAFERPADKLFTLNDRDELHADSTLYDFAGKNLTAPTDHLIPIQASQEYWHSWHTFHPGTRRYEPASPDTEW